MGKERYRAGGVILVRPYAEADRDVVNAVARAAFAQYSRDYADWPGFIDGIGRMAELAAHADVLVAEHDGAIAGAVAHVGPGRPRAAFFPDGWSVIRMLVVDPRQRGRGAGRALVAGCLRLARDAGAPAVGLHTSPVMASALRMYEALGFVRDKDLPPIRGVPYGRYVLAAADLPRAIGLSG
ncbi:GNAT family N-acetyltransferase [Massilia sp. LXY-6]|uniref:GNAT family N-acetyltransferase n=1 Tax=Massilia sp. LXY-6 TaxID=3379823 RepID=UPI003EE385FF